MLAYNTYSTVYARRFAHISYSPWLCSLPPSPFSHGLPSGGGIKKKKRSCKELITRSVATLAEEVEQRLGCMGGVNGSSDRSEG